MYNRLYITRAWRGWTQQELAKRSGVSRSTICFLEKTGGYPSIRVGSGSAGRWNAALRRCFPLKYFCSNCGRFFWEPLIFEERYGLTGPWAARFEGCPFCRVTGMIEEVRYEIIRC